MTFKELCRKKTGSGRHAATKITLALLITKIHQKCTLDTAKKMKYTRKITYF